MPKSPLRIQYDCAKCPGYCCSYPRIEVTDRDLARLAKHFDVGLEVAERKFTKFYKGEDGPERVLRQQKDEVYGSICHFFDTEARRCTVYEARPAVCREYPNRSKCGYYEFIRFERNHQDGDDYLPTVRA